ncbi:CIC11C00000002831 [Sungouiella intermedia]|uniref:CIC11C00000002831 n=1 Tax=Sungouiella intermedia TaxID=45354 RepID=A0A1L0BT35_9ASCO|nr:CIC11C00000002831 [[Candida] intermedia]
MFSRTALRAARPRGLATSMRLSEAKSDKFLTPKEFIQKKVSEDAEQQQFVSSMLKEQFDYAPKLIKEDTVDAISKRPVPLNVELLHYKPLRVPKTHGHKVAQLKFRSYEEEDIIRASEFAARAAYFLGIPCDLVKTLKTEKRLYTVIRSPFAQAKSKENFHRVTYNRGLAAYDANPEVLDLWLSYINKHSFEKVKYTAQIHTRESLDFADKLANLGVDDMKLPEAYSSDSSDPVAAKVEELLKSDTFKSFLEEKK